MLRLLVADGGSDEEYIGPGVTHVVSALPWDGDFADAAAEAPSAAFVRPEWIRQCHKQQRARTMHRRIAHCCRCRRHRAVCHQACVTLPGKICSNPPRNASVSPAWRPARAVAQYDE